MNEYLFVSATAVSVMAVCSSYFLAFNHYKIFKTFKKKWKFLPIFCFSIFAVGYATLPFTILLTGFPTISILIALVGLLPVIGVKVSIKPLLKYVPFLVVVFNIPTILRAVHSFLLIYLLQVFKESVKIEESYYKLTFSIAQFLFAVNSPLFTCAFYQLIRKGCPDEAILLSFILTWISAWILVFYGSSIVYEILRRWF